VRHSCCMKLHTRSLASTLGHKYRFSLIETVGLALSSKFSVKNLALNRAATVDLP
jgi:hypothetical protein